MPFSSSGQGMKAQALKTEYRIGGGRTLIVLGWSWTAAADCREYLATRVRGRLKASDGSVALREYLQRMPDTGFRSDELSGQIQPSRVPRDWEIGEAIAEAVLEDESGCIFPWPTGWDRREDKGSLPGVDLVGFHRAASCESTRFAFGEVKSSSDVTSPPSVVGSPGTQSPDRLVSQLRRLLTERKRRQDLIAWLRWRSFQDADSQRLFAEAIVAYFTAQPDALILGVLVRGAVASQPTDLEAIAQHLSEFAGSLELRLFAVYLPFGMKDWPALVRWEGDRP